jgi:uncharacterized damage-inducible protein DinB
MRDRIGRFAEAVCYVFGMSEPQPSPDPRYPIGRFQRSAEPDAGELRSAIQDLAELPEHLRNAVDRLGDEQLDTPYRSGGWSVRQLVHHIADSHMNAFLRVRKALTEDAPMVAAYNEQAWARLHDSLAPAEWSLELVESLHARWVMMLQPLDPAQWERTFVHPEKGPQSVELATLDYAWHGRHHVAHITHLRAARGW